MGRDEFQTRGFSGINRTRPASESTPPSASKSKLSLMRSSGRRVRGRCVRHPPGQLRERELFWWVDKRIARGSCARTGGGGAHCDSLARFRAAGQGQLQSPARGQRGRQLFSCNFSWAAALSD
jgi:hypothetical protein